MPLPFRIKETDRHICPKCQKVRSRTHDFYKRKNGQYVAWCKTCDKEQSSFYVFKRQVAKFGLVWLDDYIGNYERLLERAKKLREELVADQVAWNVWQNGQLIERVYFQRFADGGAENLSEDVKRSLIEHDGYPSDITLTKGK